MVERKRKRNISATKTRDWRNMVRKKQKLRLRKERKTKCGKADTGKQKISYYVLLASLKRLKCILLTMEPH